MPNGQFHRRVGMTAGAGVAAYRYRTVSATIAGGIGGRLGAAVPDWLEPATTPHHRGVVHSWGTAVTVGSGAAALIERLEEYASIQIREHQALALHSPAAAWWHELAAWLWSLVGAFATGVLTGFGSHIALDALTPQSLPLLVNGF
jgi:membrane-bound metal-dependent hydrolase YbcI (DUF457 family)